MEITARGEGLLPGAATLGSSPQQERTEHPVPWPFRVVAFVTFVYLLAPAVIVVLAGLNAGDYLRFPPEGLSLKWIEDFFRSDVFLPAYLFSLRLAFAVMVISTVLGTMTAIFITRVAFRGRGLVRAFFLAPLLLPGLVLGLALYTYYLNVPLGLSRTFWGLLIAHEPRFLRGARRRGVPAPQVGVGWPRGTLRPSASGGRRPRPGVRGSGWPVRGRLLR